MRHRLKQQSGQSIVEALVLFLVLLMIFMAIPWLGRISDIGLQQMNASRYAAFQLTRHEDGIDEKDLKHRFFLDKTHQWKDRADQDVINDEAIYITLDRDKKLSQHMQPGGEGVNQSTLRQEWDIEDHGIATLAIHTKPQYTQVDDRSDDPMSIGLSFLDQQVLNIQRHTSILTGIAHSATDFDAHQRTARSALAWQEAADNSYESAKKVTEIASQVDSGWNRPGPVLDWLTPWEGQLPKHHLNDKREP